MILNTRSRWLFLALLFIAATVRASLLDVSGVRGGIVTSLGADDPEALIALSPDERYLVHALERDQKNIDKARALINSKGLYGRVSVEALDAKDLPYVDDLVNLIVLRDGQSEIRLSELARVLAPRGVLCSRTDLRSKASNLKFEHTTDGWFLFSKPVPGEIDEWTHYLHGPDNNAVAHDRVVAPPRQMQWVGGPLWLRSHETPSGFEAMVLGGGRVFYILDQGLIGITDERIPERWTICCRDAFNGKLLWERKLPEWGWPQWAAERRGKDWTKLRAFRTVVPRENQRRLVTDGQRLYATLGFNAPISILDAATGEIIQTVKNTDYARELLLDGKTLVARLIDPESEGDELAAVDTDTGKIIWRQPAGKRIASLHLAIQDGRVIYAVDGQLACRDIGNGKQQWRKPCAVKRSLTLVTAPGVVLLLGGELAAHNVTDGEVRWKKPVHRRGMGENQDLFVIDGLAWPGLMCADDQFKPAGRGDSAVAVGYDLQTGEIKRRVQVANLRSTEHHHRCYRNKATTDYLISGFEGAEFLNLTGDNHLQNNWLRGSCKMGLVPGNGMLYVPPDQCFCQPGGKLLGFTTVKAARQSGPPPPTAQRLKKGPAYGRIGSRPAPPPADWPTYRHDAKRSGSTDVKFTTDLKPDWTRKLGGRLSAMSSGYGKVFVAEIDAHTVHALDAKSGKPCWSFTTGGRVDSPPTLHNEAVLFGSADGHVYCLRESDGELAWRFRAAPCDRRLGAFNQLESVWPVHGTVLLRDGVAYVAAGRSSYLDGGIRLYGLNPATGAIVHEGLIEGPHATLENRDLAFYVPGANVDVLVSEGDHIFMRQKKLTPDLKEVPLKAISSKGEADVGRHLFSTAGMLDDSWYNRAFWMYSDRWPGFQLANQSSKSGQLIVFDDKNTYSLRVFYLRNVHSPMFFPGKQGYLLFADSNDNEPQIVGEPGAKAPLSWLPMSEYARGRGNATVKLDSPSFGRDKWVGYTRNQPPLWTNWVPVRVRAMVKTADKLYAAGPPDRFDEKDPYAPFEGRSGARLIVLDTTDGELLTERDLESPPVFDGMIATRDGLFAALRDGTVRCFR